MATVSCACQSPGDGHDLQIGALGLHAHQAGGVDVYGGGANGAAVAIAPPAASFAISKQPAPKGVSTLASPPPASLMLRVFFDRAAGVKAGQFVIGGRARFKIYPMIR